MEQSKAEKLADDCVMQAKKLDLAFARNGWNDAIATLVQSAAELRRLSAIKAERDALRQKLAESENSDAESLRLYRAVRDQRDALRAEVERLRAAPAPVAQGEPVAWLYDYTYSDGHCRTNASTRDPSIIFADQLDRISNIRPLVDAA